MVEGFGPAAMVISKAHPGTQNLSFSHQTHLLILSLHRPTCPVDLLFLCIDERGDVSTWSEKSYFPRCM